MIKKKIIIVYLVLIFNLAPAVLFALAPGYDTKKERNIAYREVGVFDELSDLVLLDLLGLSKFRNLMIARDAIKKNDFTFYDEGLKGRRWALTSDLDKFEIEGTRDDIIILEEDNSFVNEDVMVFALVRSGYKIWHRDRDYLDPQLMMLMYLKWIFVLKDQIHTSLTYKEIAERLNKLNAAMPEMINLSAEILEKYFGEESDKLYKTWDDLERVILNSRLIFDKAMFKDLDFDNIQINLFRKQYQQTSITAPDDLKKLIIISYAKN